LSDAIHSVKATADVIRAVVVTRFFNLEGNIHFPRLGKEGRRLSNMLNSDRKFIAMTKVQITNRVNGSRDSKIYPFIQINIEAIEFIQPYMDEQEAEQEARAAGSGHPNNA
jgi:hypothetical protein